MAKKPDLAAAKARKQKMFLIGAGVLLLGVAVIQGPKLLKHGGSPVTAPATAAPGAIGGGASTATTAVAAVSIAPSHSFAAAAYVAGVALPGASSAPVATGKLTAFTLFAVKDPFVQQISDGSGASPGASPTAPAASANSAAPAAPSVSGAKPPAVKPLPIVFATIMLDGKPQQLQLDGKKVDKEFPKGSPLFLLAALKTGEAKIGVANGSFDTGQTVTLKLGKKVTLVDTATGVNYELKLTYTGSTAEVLASFSSAPTQPVSSSAPAGGTPSASPAATPTAKPTPAGP